MSHYDENTLEEVRRANDIVDVIGEYVPLKRSGSNYFGLCPFHSEKSPSFSVNPDRQMYHCFGCGASGTVYQFYENYLHMSFPEAVRALAERAGITLRESEDTPEQKRRKERKNQLLAVQKEAAYYYNRSYDSVEGKWLDDGVWTYLSGEEPDNIVFEMGEGLWVTVVSDAYPEGSEKYYLEFPGIDDLAK